MVAGLADQCPEHSTPVAYPPDGRLPEGAVGVRLCNGTEDYNGLETDQSDVDVPADELTHDVAAVTEVVNRALPEPTGPDTFCPADGGPDLVFWFRYEDGTAHAVRYGRHGCRWITVGENVLRQGGEDLHEAFVHALAQQRRGLSPPATVPEADCHDHWPELTVMDLEPGLDLRTAALCRSAPNGFEVATVFTPQQVRRINEDWAVAPHRTIDECGLPQRFTMLTGYTTWGDRVALYPATCWRYVVPQLRRGETVVWQPSPPIAAMFERLSARR